MGFETGASTAIRVQCLLFGRYAETFGVESVELRLPLRATVAHVWHDLRQAPSGASLPDRPLAAVNRRHAPLDQVLVDGDEVAFLPPLAGG